MRRLISSRILAVELEKCQRASSNGVIATRLNEGGNDELKGFGHGFGVPMVKKRKKALRPFTPMDI